MSVPSGPIGLTFYSDAEYFGGAEGYMAVLAAHLDRERFRPSIILPDVPGVGVLEARMRALDVEVHHLPRPGFRWRQFMPAATTLFRQIGGDVLHINLPSSYDAGLSSVALAARRAGYSRVVSTEHLPMIDRKYRRFPVKLFFSRYIDSIVVNTRSNREFLVKRHRMPGSKITVIDNGVEEAPALSAAERKQVRASFGAGEETVVIGIVGRLTRRKGHHFLLEALSQPEDELPAWVLVVAGDGDEDSALRELASRYGLSDRVHFLGHREDATRLMYAFDCLALPSTIETMPFAIIEGMAAGLPVVASAIFGIPELIEHEETGFLIQAGDVDELRKRLLQLIRDPELRHRLGEAGRRRYEERFTAAIMTEKTSRVYLGDR